MLVLEVVTMSHLLVKTMEICSFPGGPGVCEGHELWLTVLTLLPTLLIE